MVFQIAEVARYDQNCSYFCFSLSISIKQTSAILHEIFDTIGFYFYIFLFAFMF